jgi:diadenosine tetraphosphate (Ap4A) HIT family hydrolase
MLDLMARVEAGARDLFGAVRLNALCLMMQDPLFHFHLLPRYRDPVVFAGHEWVDSGWPGPPNLADNQAETDEELAELRQVYSTRAWQ